MICGAWFRFWKCCTQWFSWSVQLVVHLVLVSPVAHVWQVVSCVLNFFIFGDSLMQIQCLSNLQLMWGRSRGSGLVSGLSIWQSSTPLPLCPMSTTPTWNKHLPVHAQRVTEWENWSHSLLDFLFLWIHSCSDCLRCKPFLFSDCLLERTNLDASHQLAPLLVWSVCRVFLCCHV